MSGFFNVQRRFGRPILESLREHNREGIVTDRELERFTRMAADSTKLQFDAAMDSFLTYTIPARQRMHPSTWKKES